MATKDAPRNIMIEIKHSDAIQASAMMFDSPDTPSLTADAVSSLPSLNIDQEFGALELPVLSDPNPEQDAKSFSPFDLSGGQTTNDDHKTNNYIVRATATDAEIENLKKQIKTNSQVRAIYSDPEIQVCDPELAQTESDAAAIAQICPGSPALGTERHVAARLGVPLLRRRRMNGAGVFVAIVDTGINLAYLRSKGKRPNFSSANSWMARRGDVAGRLPVGHGTMCAYDTLIAAPRATLLDIALLRSQRSGGSVMAGLLSDAVRAYGHLYRVLRRVARPGARASMVVNNSWGMFHDSWDFPPGHPGRYADNPMHPFSRIVGVLENAGADILFAAGNCGRQCPDGRCRGVTNTGISGANSHPQVITVAGVDVLKRRVGYSTSGPGRLMWSKPDLCGYTHFRGSGVYPADGGTSAATPVVAGLVAAFRSRFPFNPADYRTRPTAIRNMLMRTAEDRGSVGFDFDYGWGIANGRRMALIRSMSVTQTSEEAATDIDQFSEIENLLDNIEGLDEVPMTEEELGLNMTTTQPQVNEETLSQIDITEDELSQETASTKQPTQTTSSEQQPEVEKA